MFRSLRMAVLLPLIFMTIIISGCIEDDRSPTVQAAAGMLDLGKAALHEEVVRLNGEWEFYPGELLQPGSSSRAQPMLAEVPMSWNSYGLAAFKDGQGHGTYRLQFLLPPGETLYSLRIPNISSAYQLWLNGKRIAEVGKVGVSSANSLPGQYPQVVTFVNREGQHELIVQVSNYHHRRGGIWLDFKLGTSKDMQQYQVQESIKQMMIFGSLFVVGFYHLGLFALRRQEKFTLYFGLLCLFVALRIVVTGDMQLLQWLPQLTWEAGLKLEYLSFVLSALCGYFYIYYLFPKDASVHVVKLSSLLSIVLSGVVLSTSAMFYSQLLMLFQLYAGSMGIYAIYVLILACRSKREGSYIVLIGFSVFVFTVLNDISFYNEWFGYVDLVPFGFFFFIIMQAFIISTRFSHALRKVEQVSEQVHELNLHLEERIEARTEQLIRSNETLEQANRELARMERSKRHLLTNISHDLRTPITLIQGYLEALQDGVVSNANQQTKYVRMMLNKAKGLNRLIDDLFDLSKLEAGQVEFHIQRVELMEWTERLIEQFQLDIESKGITFECSIADGAHQVWVEMDEFRIGQVMSNLIYNALNYTAEGGSIELSFKYDEMAQQVIVGVQDNGTGIEAEDLSYVFDRFYKKDKARHSASSGSGIGLAIVKEIVEAHQGTIRVESDFGSGSVFWMTLPAGRETNEQR